MKGVIADCLGKLVTHQFGKGKWEESLEAAGLPRDTSFLATQDIPDEAVLKVVESVCKVLGITHQQAADAFGEYWMTSYAPKIYGVYFRQAQSAKEFLLKMDEVHRITTENISNAHPPRFSYDWENDKTLIMTYHSDRGLIEFQIGLIKGVGKYFDENIKVRNLGEDKVQIQFQ